MPIVAAFDFRSAGYYAVAVMVSNMLVAPHSAIVSTLLPVAAGMSVGDSAHRMGEMLVKCSRYASAILCLIALPLMLGLHPFLRLWIGLDYADHALPLAEVLIAAQVIRLTLLPYATIGLSVGQQNRLLISPFMEGVVNLACSLVAVRLLGAMGVALGTLVGAAVGIAAHFFNSMPRTNRVLFRRRTLLVQGILGPFGLTLIPAAGALLVLSHLASAIAGIVVVSVGELTAALLLWRLNFDERERDTLKHLVWGRFFSHGAT
jgi:O-antigen/teichoic acid export membrane protein